MQFHLTVLGSNSALPAHGRNPSGQVLHVMDTPYLIDCGEGTQVRLRENGVRFMRIDHILISHLHGDHVFGLPGLVNSFGHHNRKNDLHIYGPEGIREFLESTLRLSQSRMEYKVIYHELSHTGQIQILANGDLEVWAFPLRHRITTYGYLFKKLHLERNVRDDAIEKFELQWHEIRGVKEGEPVFRDGKRVPEDELLEPKKVEPSFAYCSDTRADRGYIPYVRGCTLLYHEATFLHEAVSKAEYSMHSTAKEAAEIARAARVEQLLLGHFSSRYNDLTPLLDEARAVFPASFLAEEGRTFSIPIEE